MATNHFYPILVVTFVVVTLMTFCQGQDPPLTFTINEEEDTGTYIGSVSGANLNVPPEEIDSLRYSFLDTSQSYFSIQDETGNLFTMVKVNREDICTNFQSDIECSVTFTVAAKTTGLFYETVEVKVIILDINDNAPLFPSLSDELRISESTSINTEEFSISSAEDFDTGVNGIEMYEMSPASTVFQLKYEKDLAGSFKVAIIVKEMLDREVKDNYQFVVTAWDGGDPRKSGSMTVNIIVTDTNDNDPIFDQDEYRLTVEEGTGLGVTVVTVHASDKDIGDNGRVSYRILDSFTVDDFYLNATTGDIVVATDNLVYQQDLNYEFVVEAFDHGEQSKTDQTWVRISISDTGNNKPQVTINLLSPGNVGFVNVSEDSKKGSFVAHVTVKDTDTGLNGDVTCTVYDNYFSIIELSEKNAFKVVVNNPLNREILDVHAVNVTCTDKGTPPLSSSKAFQVSVTDYNDNKPKFVESSYKAHIPENTREEQIILQVSATDRDIGVNKDIHYEIRSQNKKIVVNSVTGVVSVKPYFDREVTPVVVFEVLAIDAGNPPLTGNATVTLTIDDVNDNAPTFVQNSYSLDVQENLNSGTTVNGKLIATDQDIGSNGLFTFSLAPEYVDSRLPFTVISDGSIQTNQALDREEQRRYDFVAMVTDQGNPTMQSSVNVVVIVNDVNDNKPNITFPTSSNRTVTISYPNNDLDIVTRIQANDPDDGENSTLQYVIVNGNDLGLFKMDSKTGVVSVANHKVKIDENFKVLLSVEVSDNGVQSLVSSAELVVNVMYSNATYPEYTTNENKIIVIVVVVVTLLLSAIIIAVIFLLRSFDRKKKLSGAPAITPDNNYTNKPTVCIMNNTGESSSDYHMVNNENARKKKEVSFSLDEHDSAINVYQHVDLQVAMTPEPIKYAPEKPPRQESPDSTKDLYDKVTTRLETLKLQQMLMETRAKQQLHAVPHSGNPDDSRSESSGETSSGDSGRGASEEEIPSASPSHDDRVFEYSMPIKSSNPASTHVPSRAANYSIVPPPIPSRSYKPYASFDKKTNINAIPFDKTINRNSMRNTNIPSHNNSSSSQQYLNDFSNGYSSPHSHRHADVAPNVLDPSALSWQHSQPHSHYPIKSNNYAQSDYSYVTPRQGLPPMLYRPWSSQDDDDCSTTTSGSYTLHSIDDLL